MAIYTLGPLMGPVIGPIAGGFIAETIGFKYIFIVIVGFTGVGLLIGIPFLRETYAPVIRLRRARAMNDHEMAAKVHPDVAASDRGATHLIWINLSRPIMLLCSLVCFMLSLYMSLYVPELNSIVAPRWITEITYLAYSMYGIFYLMFTTFPSISMS